MSFREQLETAIKTLETQIKDMRTEINDLYMEIGGFQRQITVREDKAADIEKEMEKLIKEKKVYTDEANGLTRD